MILMMWSTQQDRTHRGMLDAFLRWMGKHRNCRFGIMSTASGTSESIRSAHKSSSVRFQFLGHVEQRGQWPASPHPQDSRKCPRPPMIHAHGSRAMMRTRRDLTYRGKTR